MEQLYPRNILERHYPVLREQREREERAEAEEKIQRKAKALFLFESVKAELHENEPLSDGSVGRRLNTIA